LHEFKLRGQQWELFNLMQSDINCCFVVSIRSGKTLLCFLHAVQECLQKENINVVYIAPTNQMLRNIMVREFLPYLTDAPYCEVTDTEVRFTNGSRIFFLSAEKPERLRGITIDLAIADECATMKESVVTELINRTARTPGRQQGKVVMITTPHGKNWFHDFIHGSEDHSGILDNEFWHYRKYDAFEMKVIDKETIERLRETKDEVSFNQDVMCDFAEVRGKIFKNWKEQYIRNVQYDKSKPLYIGMDFNYDPMTAIIAHKVGDSFHIFDEIYLRYSETEEVCEEIKARYGLPGMFIFPDASGGAASAVGGKSRTNHKILKKHFGDCLKHQSKNPPVLDTINEVNELLRQGRITISPKCKNLIKTMDNYSWKEGSNQPDKNGYDHMADCMRYLVHGVFPIRREVDLASQPQTWNQVVRG